VVPASVGGSQDTIGRVMAPEALGAFQKAEIEKWWPIIKEAGIKAQLKPKRLYV
jgi:hypothetical protein